MRKLLPLLAALLLLGGCAGRRVLGNEREIDQLVPVQTLGVDRQGRLYSVTASSSAEGQVLLKTPAVTLDRALREMQNYAEKKYIFYGHVRHLLLGASAAGESLTDCLRFVERDGELRMDTKLYVVRDGRAEDAVSLPGGGDESVGDLLDSLEKDVQLLSDSHVFSCAETSEALAERGCALISALRLSEPENLLGEEWKKTLLSAGYAIVADGRLAGWLDPDLARGANLLMGFPGGDVIEAPDGKGGWFAADLVGSRVRFHPEFTGGALTGLRLQVELRCCLDELSRPLDLRDREAVRTLEEGIAAVELWRVSEVLRISREMGADFCGLERGVRRAAPLRFDRMGEAWQSLFPRLPVTAEVSVRLLRTYESGIEPLGSTERAAS